MDTASAFDFLYGNEWQLPVHKRKMLQACQTGDLSQLQQIYQAHNIQPGAKLDWMENDSRPTTVFKLFVTAIIHEHVRIVSYLLSMHPERDLNYELVAQAIIDHPNLEIMELVRAHQPDIVNLGWLHIRTFLTEACRVGGDKTLPLIHYLLDNGADPQEGSWRDCGALHAALEFSRPLEIIDKMVEKGGTVDSLIFSQAVMARRVDALELFFEKATFRCSTDEMIDVAQKSKDKEVKSVVKPGVAKLRKREQGKPKW